MMAEMIDFSTRKRTTEADKSGVPNKFRLAVSAAEDEGIVEDLDGFVILAFTKGGDMHTVTAGLENRDILWAAHMLEHDALYGGDDGSE